MFLLAEKVQISRDRFLRQLICCLRANEEKTEDSQHRGSSIALQQKTIHNTQEDIKGWSRVGPA